MAQWFQPEPSLGTLSRIFPPCNTTSKGRKQELTQTVQPGCLSRTHPWGSTKNPFIQGFHLEPTQEVPPQTLYIPRVYLEPKGFC